MWWQDQLEVLRGMGPTRGLLLMALIMAIDAVTGWSQLMANKLKLEKQKDAMIFSLALVLLYQILMVGDFLPVRASNFTFFISTASTQAERIAELRQLRLFELELWFLHGLFLVCAVACAMLARRGGKSALIWFGLGYLGNVGSIVWLLVNRGRADAIAQPERPV